MDVEQIVALVVAAAGIIVALLEARGKARLGRTLRAVIRGAESGSKRAGTREIKRAICDEAIKAGVEELLRSEVERETGEAAESCPERE